MSNKIGMMDGIEKKFWLSVFKKLKTMVTGVKVKFISQGKHNAIQLYKDNESVLLDDFITGKEYDIIDVLTKCEKWFMD